MNTSRNPTKYILIATAIVIPLLAASTAVSMWRYEHALGARDRADVSLRENEISQRARLAFWREREAINEWLLTPEAEIKEEIDGQLAEFDRATDDLLDERPAERALALKARTANAAFLRTFDVVSRNPGQAEVIERLNAQEEAVVQPLDALQQEHEIAPSA